MDTKARGDIAEQAAVFHAMKRGWAVLKPMGDRLPYDVVFDLDGVLVKIQVKMAWKYKKGLYEYFACDSRRCKTNRKTYIIDHYNPGDFHYAMIYVEPWDIFYVFPETVFNGYSGNINLCGTGERQIERKQVSEIYRDKWQLIERFARRSKNGLDNDPNSEQDFVCGMEELATSPRS